MCIRLLSDLEKLKLLNSELKIPITEDCIEVEKFWYNLTSRKYLPYNNKLYSSKYLISAPISMSINLAEEEEKEEEKEEEEEEEG